MILMIYNLPLMFLSTIILGSNSPGHNIMVVFNRWLMKWNNLVIQDFDLWCIEEIEFSDEDSFDVDY